MTNSNRNSLDLRQLLSEERYKVPVYQRNFDWCETQIQQLIDDIQDFAEKDDESISYYIGSLVVHQKNDYFEILDGQQRFTTLCLLACYLKHRLPESFKWYKEINLGFESRSKSGFSIDHLFKVFCSAKSPEYISSAKLSELISTIDTKKANTSILEGFKAIDRVITRNFNNKVDKSLNKFTSYLLNQVKILPVLVPKNTDVTHYFEVMNNRGEQLEKHEVVKANLLSAVQEDKQVMATIQKIWLACSDMSRYVQLGFWVEERNAIFDMISDSDRSEDSLVKKFEFLNNQISRLSNGSGSNVSSETLTLTLEDALLNGNNLRVQENKNSSKKARPDKNDEGKEERFTSIIDFPNFLMQVLRIYLKSEPGKESLALDDKDLITAFRDNIGKDVRSVKGFVVTLLNLRYLFDHYIIKRERGSVKEDWSLKRYKFDKNSSSYVNSFGMDEVDKSSENLSCMMLQSAFHVSYPTNSRKNWLSAALYWLSDKDKSTPITAEEYLKFLENLARAFMVNRYLVLIPKEYVDFMYTVNKSEQFTLSAENLSQLLSYGSTRVFVFNYLDYLLWKNPELLQDKKSKFRFSFKSSVEHFSPQTPKANEILEERVLHSFGNLCLMGTSENSSLSNDSPQEKQRILERRRGNMTPLSLKLELMMTTVLKENAWNDTDIKSHEKDMFKVLKEGIERAI